MEQRRYDSMRGIPGWLTFAGALVAAGLLGLLLFAISIRAGVVAGPPVELRLGDYYLVARATEHPACLPLPEQCFIPRPTFRLDQPRYYSVWAGRLRPGRAGSFPEKRGRLLLKLPIGAAALSP